MRPLAADVAGVRLDRLGAQAAAPENANVGIVHHLVIGVCGFQRRVEAVGVHHEKFLGAHQAEARADFITELGLDLVDGAGKLAVGIDLAGDEIGDDLFVRGAQRQQAFLTILQLEHARAHGGEAAGLFPQIGRLQRRHEDFERASAVHLLADDALHLLQGAQSQRQEGVQAAGKLADAGGPQHEFVAVDLRFLGIVAESCDEGTCPAHGVIDSC